MKHHRFFLVALLICILPVCAFSEAPVVDDSENFALLDEQQASERPVVKHHARAFVNDEEYALAHDRDETSHNSTSNNASLLDKIQGLQQDVQELRGQIEVQAHDLKLLQQQQLAFYKDLDARLRNEPTKTAKLEAPTELSVGEKPMDTPATIRVDKTTINQKAKVEPAVNNVSRVNPAEEQISYLAAYQLIQNKQFDEALTAMQTFVTHYPQGGYTANAYYWLGELYMVKKNYPEAIKHFEVVLQQYPSSSKSAASMLKTGYALAASGKKHDAIQTLQQVVKNYPDTNTAHLAKAKLESLNS